MRAQAKQKRTAEIATRLPVNVPRIRVMNKIDLVGQEARRSGSSSAAELGEPGSNRRENATDGGGSLPTVWLSARTGAGVELLRTALLRVAGWHRIRRRCSLARERHLTALRNAREHLIRAEGQVTRLELFAEELRLAQNQLSSITGEFTADDLLGEIFSRFCIGK